MITFGTKRSCCFGKGNHNGIFILAHVLRITGWQKDQISHPGQAFVPFIWFSSESLNLISRIIPALLFLWANNLKDRRLACWCWPWWGLQPDKSALSLTWKKKSFPPTKKKRVHQRHGRWWSWLEQRNNKLVPTRIYNLPHPSAYFLFAPLSLSPSVNSTLMNQWGPSSAASFELNARGCVCSIGQSVQLFTRLITTGLFSLSFDLSKGNSRVYARIFYVYKKKREINPVLYLFLLKRRTVCSSFFKKKNNSSTWWAKI